MQQPASGLGEAGEGGPFWPKGPRRDIAGPPQIEGALRSTHWLPGGIVQDARTTAIVNYWHLLVVGALKLHPIITRLVDAETLKKVDAERMATEEDSSRVPTT